MKWGSMAPRKPAPRVSLSVKIDAEVAQKARQLARDYAGKPHYLRINAIVEDGLRRFIEEFVREHGEDGEGEPRRDRTNRNSLPNR